MPSQPKYLPHHVHVLSQSFWVFRCVKTPFLPFSPLKFEKNGLVFVLLSWFPLAHCAGWERIPSHLCSVCMFGMYFLPPLACVHFRNLYLPLSRPRNAGISCFFLLFPDTLTP